MPDPSSSSSAQPTITSPILEEQSPDASPSPSPSPASRPRPPQSPQRRLSTQERIDSILETAHRRSIAMKQSPDAQPFSMSQPYSIGVPISRMASNTSQIAPDAQAGETESSADERTSIVRRDRSRIQGYQSTASNSNLRARNSRSNLQRSQEPSQTQNGAPNGNGHVDENDTDDQETRWKKVLAKFGSIELDNKGSVARDHLALERTFLAWLRTSLAFASIGIAITQLFRLNTSISTTPSASDPYIHLRQLGKPLGATFLAISIVVLFVGFHRYFESQHWIIRGKFPASRGSVAIVAVIACLLMVTSLVVVLVVEPGAFEK